MTAGGARAEYRQARQLNRFRAALGEVAARMRAEHRLQPLPQERELLWRFAGDDSPFAPTFAYLLQPFVAPPEGQTARSTRAHFEELRLTWRRATQFFSTPKKIFGHPAYRQIVSMGRGVVPFILDELENNPDPDLWSDALAEITGERIDLAPEDRGRMELVAAAWLRLAREKGWRGASQ